LEELRGVEMSELMRECLVEGFGIGKALIIKEGRLVLI